MDNKKKPVAKKPVAKKPVAKKPVAKKPVAKKPVAKKPVAKKPVEMKVVMGDEGIDNLKNVMLFFTMMGNAVGKALEDKKFKPLREWHLFVPALMRLPKAISSMEKLPAEIKDLDEAELQQLVDFVKSKFDIEQDAVEEQVEDSIDISLKFIDFVNKTIVRFKK